MGLPRGTTRTTPPSLKGPPLSATPPRMQAGTRAHAAHLRQTPPGDPFELDVYLRRVGLSPASLAEHAPGSFALLHAIAWAQATHIPFENLATLYPTMRLVGDAEDDAPAALAAGKGLPIRSSLQPADIYRKLVCRNRGGFCFEQNLLLARALREVDFEVDLIAAKGVNRAAEETSDGHALSCFTHLVLIAHTHDGQAYLVDDGFGWAGAPRQPLALADGVVVEDGNTGELYRLVRGDEIPSGEAGFERWGHRSLRVGARGALDKAHERDSRGWFLQYKPSARAEEFWDMYHFRSDGRVTAMDCEPGAWFASSHPSHKQTQVKLVARMTDDGRVSLVDDVLTMRRRGEVVFERKLRGAEDPDELAEVLKEHFGIDFRP
jgi:N-hydroxyarylamine O-acetyltransferase